MESPIPYGTVVSGGETQTISFALRFPQPVEEVWAAVATPEGLACWLAAAAPFEQHQGGAVTLRWLDPDEHGAATVAPGRVTGWGPSRLAEYTVDAHGRIRFELVADPDRAADGAPGTRLRFTNELTAPYSAALRHLAGWHQHFEFLVEALAGRSADWRAWNLERWRALHGAYERAR
ncbi:SRPBCC domain-containing protein [Streptomyces sp. NPDC017993]|uniref:SRPBCC domain-containing protein n=1 Tax=Streptomyces sp. NPDC017993 TaxID=3365027 RepID=UPI0037AC4E57